MEASWETFPGLNAILESPRWSVAKSCQAVEACIDANRDNLRGFFEQCFSLLLKCIFGYEGASWLNSVTKGGADADAKALVGVLSPGSRLLQAVHSADADALIKFMFPQERLPTHSQLLLAIDSGRQELASWPQYTKRIVRGPGGRPAIHLDVFGYYVFWTAFYVLRGSQTAAPAPVAPRQGRLAYSSIAPSLGTVRKTLRLGAGHTAVEGHAYLRLLRLYLERYLPRTAQDQASNAAAVVASPVRRARARHSSAGNEGAVLLSVLLEFWLSDGDQPLPPGPSQDVLAGMSSAARQNSLDGWTFAAAGGPRSYEAPSEDLTEALTVLTRYVYSLEDPGDAAHPLKPAQSSSFVWLPATPQPPAAPSMMHLARNVSPPHRLGPAAMAPAQAYSKRLFRFLYRAFSRWPERRPLTPVVNLWLAVLAPWWPHGAATGDVQPPWRPTSTQGQPFPARDGNDSSGGRDLSRKLTGVINRVGHSHGHSHRSDTALTPRYGPEWEAHVLCNLPMWTVLMPLFLDQMLARVSSLGDLAVSDLLAVLRVLQAAPNLVSLLKGAEITLAPLRGLDARRDSAAFADLVPWLSDQAIEWAAIACACLDTSAAPPSMPEMQLFAEGQPGAAARIQAILKAGRGAVRPELLHATSEAAAAVLPMASLPEATSPDKVQARPEGLPVQGALKRGRWEDLRYKGDWMLRPISSNEIGWLVRLLLRLSGLLNHLLYLDGRQPPRPATPNMALGVLLALHGAAASRGWRINLRPLAEVQTLAWTPIFLFAFWISWHILLVMWRVLTEPYDNNEHAVQPLQTHRQNVHRMPATTHAHSRLHQIPHAMQDRV